MLFMKEHHPLSHDKEWQRSGCEVLGAFAGGSSQQLQIGAPVILYQSKFNEELSCPTQCSLALSHVIARVFTHTTSRPCRWLP